jgi:His/Glu/Gln/Arg/opine family amino acid ABC transporter permease subunit
MKSKKIWAVVVAIVIAVAAIAGISIYINSSMTASEISLADAESFVNSEYDALATTKALKLVASKNKIKVNKISYGDKKDIILDCELETLDVHSVISPNYNMFLSSDEKKANGTMFKSALDFKIEFEPLVLELIADAPIISDYVKITLFEMKDGLVLYADKLSADKVFGGAATIESEVSEIKSVTYPNGKIKKIESGNVNKGLINNFSFKYDGEIPDTSNFAVKIWNSVKRSFVKNFIDHGRWKTIITGLWVTIKLTVCALLIGIALGFMVAFVRCTRIKNPKSGIVIKILDKICGIYLTITRGTPVVVQIMIIYFVIFMPLGVDKFLAAVICFGLNSGAYVAEIVRGGIMSIDQGQTEAGRSLGFGYMATMWHIVFPQAFKAVLPALANEFVVLLKETSIAFYIGLGDLMYAGNAIRAATYSAFMPLVAVAVIYLIMVLALSKLVSILERRLRNSER